MKKCNDSDGGKQEKLVGKVKEEGEEMLADRGEMREKKGEEKKKEEEETVI